MIFFFNFFSPENMKLKWKAFSSVFFCWNQLRIFWNIWLWVLSLVIFRQKFLFNNKKNWELTQTLYISLFRAQKTFIWITMHPYTTCFMILILIILVLLILIIVVKSVFLRWCCFAQKSKLSMRLSCSHLYFKIYLSKLLKEKSAFLIS